MSTDENFLDDLALLQIDMAAVTACMHRRDYDPLTPPGAQMTDNDYRAGIRQTFGDHEEFEDWMVAPMLAEVKRNIALNDSLKGILPALRRFM